MIGWRTAPLRCTTSREQTGKRIVGKVFPKCSRYKILTAELVARVERMEPDPGPEPGTSEHTDAEFNALVEGLWENTSPMSFGFLLTAH